MLRYQIRRIVLASFVAMAMSVCRPVGAQVLGQWPMGGNDPSHAGISNSGGMPSPDPLPIPGTLKWSYKPANANAITGVAIGPYDGNPDPVSGDKIIYPIYFGASDYRVYCRKVEYHEATQAYYVNDSTGWTSAVLGGTAIGTPVLANLHDPDQIDLAIPTVLVTCTDGRVYARNASDGTRRWTTDTIGAQTTPLVAMATVAGLFAPYNYRVYVGTASGLRAIREWHHAPRYQDDPEGEDLDNVAYLWSFQSAGNVPGCPSWAGILGPVGGATDAWVVTVSNTGVVYKVRDYWDVDGTTPNTHYSPYDTALSCVGWTVVQPVDANNKLRIVYGASELDGQGKLEGRVYGVGGDFDVAPTERWTDLTTADHRVEVALNATHFPAHTYAFGPVGGNPCMGNGDSPNVYFPTPDNNVGALYPSLIRVWDQWPSANTANGYYNNVMSQHADNVTSTPVYRIETTYGSHVAFATESGKVYMSSATSNALLPSFPVSIPGVTIPKHDLSMDSSGAVVLIASDGYARAYQGP